MRFTAISLFSRYSRSRAWLGLLLAGAARAAAPADSPLVTVRAVADRVLRDTSFELVSQPAEDSQVLQGVDFPNEPGGGWCYATSEVVADRAGLVTMGVTSSAPIRIWVNGHPALDLGHPAPFAWIELESDRYSLPDAFRMNLQAGRNSVLVEVRGDVSVRRSFRIAPVLLQAEATPTLRYSLPAWKHPAGSRAWLTRLTDSRIGPAGAVEIGDGQAANLAWVPLALPTVKTARIPADAAFRAHSYALWGYANGTMLRALIALSGATGDLRYRDFARRACDFTLDHQDQFEAQVRDQQVLRGFDADLFRPVALDFTGGAGLPYLELARAGDFPRAEPLVRRIGDYLEHGQHRLADGTFCRLEPMPGSVWCDDLYMSVPYLLGMAAWQKDPTYRDDAARQLVQLPQYLFDPAKGLYFHGWFGPIRQHSAAHWGRANGWIAWASAEGLAALPKDDPNYPAILAQFRRHMAGLAAIQAPDGRWRQILDNPSSWEETSCSAMFALAMARGARSGWLEPRYGAIAERAWAGVAAQVDAQGGVHGIDQSTPMGASEDFYLKLKTRLNDPRGLGGFFAAGIELAEYEKDKTSHSFP